MASLNAMMPSATAVSLYSSAMALSALGPGARSKMSEADWDTIVGNFGKAAKDGTGLTDSSNAIPVSYVLWEMMLADRMNGILTEDQRASLARVVSSSDLTAKLIDHRPDIPDIYVTVDALRGLGALSAPVREQAAAFVAKLPSVCDVEPDSSDVIYALELGALRDVASPCSEKQFSGTWDRYVAALLAASAPDQQKFDSDPCAAALWLAESLQLWWPDDQHRSNMLGQSMDNCVSRIRAGRINPTDSDGTIMRLQQGAFVLGKTLPDDGSSTQRLVEQAVRGTQYQQEQFQGVQMAQVLTGAAAVGADVSLTDGFVAGLSPLEYMAVMYGQGRGDDPSVEQKLRQVKLAADASQSDRNHAVGAVGALLLSLPQDAACASAGVSIIKQAFAPGDAEYMDQSSVALGVRALERCDEVPPAGARQAALSFANSIMSASGVSGDLDAQWRAQRVLCALDPEHATVGQDTWSGLQSFVNPEGGAVDSTGFASLYATYQLLSIVTTTPQECTDTGLLDPRP